MTIRCSRCMKPWAVFKGQSGRQHHMTQACNCTFANGEVCFLATEDAKGLVYGDPNPQPPPPCGNPWSAEERAAWIASHDSKPMSNLERAEQRFLEAVKGFEAWRQQQDAASIDRLIRSVPGVKP